MKLFLFLLGVAFLSMPHKSTAQTRVYKSYNVKDGLAGSTVYYSYQDKKGFIWFGTDQGLSRFDGTNFKNYTSQDGLPDNEVFKIAEDSVGRLWMICYGSKPCFMYNGVIHNATNDTLLARIGPETSVFRNLSVDNKGRVWIFGPRLYIVDNTKLRVIEFPGGVTSTGVGSIGSTRVIATGTHIYEMLLTDDTVTYTLKANLDSTTLNASCFFANACYVLEAIEPIAYVLIKISADTIARINLSDLGIGDIIMSHTVYNARDSVLLVSSGSQGIKAFTANMKMLPDPYPFLPQHVFYEHTLFDREGNTWVSSAGKGVFFIPVNKTIRYSPAANYDNYNATSVFSTNGSLIIGSDDARYGMLKDEKIVQYIIDSFALGVKVIKQCQVNGNDIMLGTNRGLYQLRHGAGGYCRNLHSRYLKNMVAEGPDSILVAGLESAFRFITMGTSYKVQILWNEKTTAIAKDKSGTIWLGSLKGLYLQKGDSTTRFSKNALLNNSRITDLLCDDYGNIWVATHQRGIFVITTDSVININTRNGLPEDMCLRFFKESGVIWLCTSHNIVKIAYQHSAKGRFEISTPVQLLGNEGVQVNDVFVDSSNIWVATTNGLFKTEKISENQFEAPQVYINAFRWRDSFFNDFKAIRLGYFQNDIQIDYVGISYNSGGKILYKYLLNNSAGDTFYTRNTALNFSSLAPGIYNFKVWAKNIAGKWSECPASVSFEISQPFWKTRWFVLAILTIAAVAIWCLFKWREKNIRDTEKQKREIAKKVAEIEVQSLRAQMNPHFVFNCLAAIRDFILRNDISSAEYYLSSFAKLIRKVFDNARKQEIALNDEIEFLRVYLELERMRFNNKFDYNFLVADGIDEQYICLPPMILQPFVENAVRHSKIGSITGQGILNITFGIKDGNLVCIIEDNGIGIKREIIEKRKKLPHGLPHALDIINERIWAINQANQSHITYTITNKSDTNNHETGTVVEVNIPLIFNSLI